MARVDNYQLASLPGFPLGYVRESDSSKLLATELVTAQNFHIDPRGELEYRRGYEPYSLGFIGAPIEWLYGWRADNGLTYMIAITTAGAIWSSAGVGGAWANSGSNIGSVGVWSDFGVSFASAGDKLYISSITLGANPVITFDGTTWGTAATVPISKNLIYRHERMFAGNQFTPNWPNGSAQRIWFSNLADVEVFDIEDFIDVNPQDGQPIMKMIEFGDSIIIFKTRSIWQLAGRTPQTFSLYQLDNQRGSISPRSIVVHNGLLYFFDRNTGVWTFDGATFGLISEPINSHILDEQTFDQAYTASGYAVKERRYYLSMDIGVDLGC